MRTLGTEPDWRVKRGVTRVLVTKDRTEFELPHDHVVVHVGTAATKVGTGESVVHVPAIWFEIDPESVRLPYEAVRLRTGMPIPMEDERGGPYVHLGSVSSTGGEAVHVYARRAEPTHEEKVAIEQGMKVAAAILRDPNMEFHSANNMAGTMSREDAVASISDEERAASEKAAEELLEGTDSAT